MSLTEDLLPYMRRVQAAGRDLHDLTQLWQTIEASAAISCPRETVSILSALGETRRRFDELQRRLVRQLADEQLAELGDELGSVAQCSIDILVRNLFERTADVGFLATDDPLRDFCAASAAERHSQCAGIRKRLGAYRSKYTVYDDIVVLDTGGAVLARLADGGIEHSADEIVKLALTRGSWVERHGPSDLADCGRPALLYGHRIADLGGRAIGVLVMRFRLSDELQRIFASVQSANDGVAVALIDADGRVLFSNDEAHVPPGVLLRTGEPGQVALTAFAGREYLSVTCQTRGYQGYMGPGWRAHAMISMVTAFRSRHAGDDNAMPIDLDNTELRAIQEEVDTINRSLRRMVWNGRLRAGLSNDDDLGARERLKAVLQQVSQAGMRTSECVAGAIRDLYGTSIGRLRQQAHDLARLAADIMDRNLYERANDCRWWALSPVLRDAIQQPPGRESTDRINPVLAHINALYTVYTRLVVFDADGLIRGVSADDQTSSLVGTQVDPEWVAAVQQLGDAQRYAVTGFTPTPLYGGESTYVYLAAIRRSDNRSAGGIAIVFNAAREFRAMLDDVLGGRAGYAAFVDRHGYVISSTDERWPNGSTLLTGASSGVVAQEGISYAQAVAATPGYREFKVEDGYDNGVRVVVALRLGQREQGGEGPGAGLFGLPTREPQQRREFALVRLGPSPFALPAGDVVEALPARNLVVMPNRSALHAGMMEVPTREGPRVVQVLSGRAMVGLEQPVRTSESVVVVVRPQGATLPTCGLLVDELLAVVEVGPEHRQPIPAGLRAGAPMLSGLLRVGSASGKDVIVQELEAAALIPRSDVPVALG